MMKNTFYFMLKTLFIPQISKYLSQPFCYVEEQLDEKVKVNFKIQDVKNWITNNCNTYIVQYHKK